jgi:CelD/BcsL family acetyltransferase involved in cellulose biosynthesis
MYESRIAADQLMVTATEGFPPEIDALATRSLSQHGFLRAAWYQGGAERAGRTLLVRRSGGGIIAALPTVAFGPVIGRLRKISGAYWPFRAPLIANDCSPFELAQALEHRGIRDLGPVWRLGPARLDDPSTRLLVEAAQLAGWSVLARPAGTSWVIDLAAARANGYPRPSVARKLRAAWRKLEALGQPHWIAVRGEQWNYGVLELMGRIEAQSWIARRTDGSGAKFLTAQHRSVWLQMLGDPLLSRSLSAVILMLGDRPVAFCFDLDDGPVRYGIAGSHVEDMKRFNIGKLANYRSMADAIAAGQRVLDLGAGDSGYKAEMGALEGYDLTDLLFVRHRPAALLMARMWGEELALPAQIELPRRMRAHG